MPPIGRVAITDTWRSEQGDMLRFERLDRFNSKQDRERMSLEAFLEQYELRTRNGGS